jgi:8-oxo-dGTP diphosphatase
VIKENQKAFTDYPQPAVAVDLALLAVSDGKLKVLLMRRPDADQVGGTWALPGGFVRIEESLEDAVTRVLKGKANLQEAYLEQLGTYGDPSRDPRGRVISIAYFALSPLERLEAAIGGKEDLVLASLMVSWPGEEGGPAEVIGPGNERLDLAFDHAEILGQVVKRLRGKLDYTAVGLELLPKRFTLRAVQEIHEAILGRKLTKPAFRRKLLDRGLIRATGEREEGTTFRPAELYEGIES